MKALLYLEIARLMTELVSVEVDNEGSTVCGDNGLTAWSWLVLKWIMKVHLIWRQPG